MRSSKHTNTLLPVSAPLATGGIFETKEPAGLVKQQALDHVYRNFGDQVRGFGYRSRVIACRLTGTRRSL